MPELMLCVVLRVIVCVCVCVCVPTCVGQYHQTLMAAFKV